MIETSLQARYRRIMSINDVQIALTYDLVRKIALAFNSGHRVYAFGNGGSAAQAQHFTTELIGRFKGNRKSLPAISLSADTSAITAIANDFGFDSVFSRQLESLAQPGDVVIGFTTSGTSVNVLKGLAEAKKNGASTVLICGNKGESKAHLADLALEVGGSETAVIQEVHLILIHIICENVEYELGLVEPGNKKFIPRIVYDHELSEIQLPTQDSIVWVNGCFDLLHQGHIRLLNTASKSGSFLVVGINSDESVKRLKGTDRPFIPEVSRARTLLELPFVDLVVIFSDDDPLDVLKVLIPSVVVKGPEYRDREYPEKNLLMEMGCSIVYIEDVEGVSSTQIADRILTNGLS